MSVRPSLKISVSNEPIGFYSSGNTSTGPVVIFYFLGGWPSYFFQLPLGAKRLEARCEAASPSIK